MSISCQQLALALLLMQMASLNSRGPKLAGVFVHFCWPNNLLTRDSPKSLNYGARKERVMKRISKRIMLMTFLSLAMSGIPARARDSQGSSQDKAKACNSMADDKGLKGDDRKNFMQDCLSKAGNEQLNQMSQK